MADDRLARAQRRWGAVSLALILGIGCSWLYHGVAELTDLVERVGAKKLKDRMSQLKPAGFKFPWSGLYMILTALVCVGIVSWLVVAGIRDARRGEPGRPD